MRSLTIMTILVCYILVMCGNSLAVVDQCRKVDEFGDMPCGREQARLDNYWLQLSNEAESQGYLIFYEGKYWEGRNPRHGEAFAEASKYKDYLVRVLEIKPDRIIIIDGGYREKFTVELYLCQRGGVMPTASPTLKKTDVRFRKGKLTKYAYKWMC
jgi:hypothetical protein